MNKLFYPATFHKAEEGGFWVTFPDFPECMTQGDDMEEAYRMSVDALGLAITSTIEDGNGLPSATEPDSLQEDGTTVIIEFDYETYRKQHCSKAIKKTLSIPEWLNEEAMAMGINFSQVLQEALLTKIQTK